MTELIKKKQQEKESMTLPQVLASIQKKKDNGVISEEVAKFYSDKITKAFYLAVLDKNEQTKGEFVKSEDRDRYLDMTVSEALSYSFARLSESNRSKLRQQSRFEVMPIVVMKKSLFDYVKEYSYLEKTDEGSRFYSLTDIIGCDVVGKKLENFDFHGIKLNYEKGPKVVSTYLQRSGINPDDYLETRNKENVDETSNEKQ